MSVNTRGEIDRAIDDALATIPHAEPRRVSAASVRRARQPRRFGVPGWLALAAVLVVGFVVSFAQPPFVEEAPRVTTPPMITESASTRGSPSVDPAPSSASEEAVTAFRRLAARRSVARPAAGRAFERQGQLPPLTLEGVEVPPALVTASLESHSIQIPSLDIAPLSVTTLSLDPDHKQ